AFASDLVHRTATDSDRKMWMKIRKRGLSTTLPVSTMSPPRMTSPSRAPTSQQRFDRRIIDGPLTAAVWHLAWPAMLQNAIGGAQGIVDHAMVGQVVGFTGNAAIGVSWQIFLIVIVFISSLYTGMGVLVARHAGGGDAETVNRVVYQAFLTSIFLSLGVLAPI